MKNTTPVIILLTVVMLSFAGMRLGAQPIEKDRLTITAYGGPGVMINALNIYEHLIDTKVYGCTNLEIGFQTRNTDNDFFAWAFNNPQMGIGLSYQSTGSLQFKNDSYLSDLYTLYGFFRGDIVRSGTFALGPFINLGGTFSPATYDYYSNPANTYVGTNFLVYIGLGLDGRFHAGKNTDIGLKTTVAHRSNGMLRVPNHGLNMFETAAYVRYAIGGTETVKRGSKPALPDLKKWNFDIYSSGGVHSCDVERHVGTSEKLPEDQRWTECKQYLRLNLGGSVSYRYHPVFSTGLGVDFFYTGNAKALEKCQYIMTGETVDLDPFHFGVYIQQNFHYRNIAACVALGAYLYKNLGPEDSEWDYQRATLRYFMPSLGNMFIGFGFKAHMFDRSDTLEFTLGKRF